MGFLDLKDDRSLSRPPIETASEDRISILKGLIPPFWAKCTIRGRIGLRLAGTGHSGPACFGYFLGELPGKPRKWPGLGFLPVYAQNNRPE